MRIYVIKESPVGETSVHRPSTKNADLSQPRVDSDTYYARNGEFLVAQCLRRAVRHSSPPNYRTTEVFVAWVEAGQDRLPTS
jgi:hypothetical protein